MGNKPFSVFNKAEVTQSDFGKYLLICFSFLKFTYNRKLHYLKILLLYFIFIFSKIIRCHLWISSIYKVLDS